MATRKHFSIRARLTSIFVLAIALILTFIVNQKWFWDYAPDWLSQYALTVPWASFVVGVLARVVTRLCLDALERRESCGGHFRTEFQTPDGEAKRDDDNFAYVAAWEYAGPGNRPILNKEPLVYEDVHMSTRSYK